MIRLAFVINNLNVGGAERLLLSTIKALDKSHFKVVVCTLLRGNSLLEEFQKNGIEVFSVNMSHKRDIRGVYRLYSFFRRNKIEIVHTHLNEADIWGRYAAILARVPVVLSTDHRVDDWRRKTFRLKTRARVLLNRLACKLTDGIIPVSDEIKTHLIENEKIGAEKIFVIKNGITVDHFLKIREKPVNDKEIILGNVARLSPEKGHTYLLEAVKELSSEFNNFKLLIAGTGQLRSHLAAECQKMKINHLVQFCGTFDDITNFLKQIDIFILPSLIEGIPLALLEAMAAQKPIVATKIGSVIEVIKHETDGILVEPQNAHELKKAIKLLIDNSTLRTKIAGNARKKVTEKFNLKTKVLELENLYQKLYETNAIKT